MFLTLKMKIVTFIKLITDVFDLFIGKKKHNFVGSMSHL